VAGKKQSFSQGYKANQFGKGSHRGHPNAKESVPMKAPDKKEGCK
jgi:hypothetical protein